MYRCCKTLHLHRIILELIWEEQIYFLYVCVCSTFVRWADVSWTFSQCSNGRQVTWLVNVTSLCADKFIIFSKLEHISYKISVWKSAVIIMVNKIYCITESYNAWVILWNKNCTSFVSAFYYLLRYLHVNGVDRKKMQYLLFHCYSPMS